MAYIGNSPQFATQIPYRYTVTVAGTTVTGLDDLGKALTYTPGYVAVYVNGVKLIETLDYVATSGSSVVFVNAVQIGDVVEIIAYGTYSISYAYRASAIAPVNAAVGDLWYDLSTGILAIYINDGTTSAWMQIAPTGILDPASSQFVRYDAAQTATTAQQTQARSNIAAAPLNALAYSGLQINGSCEISQELGATPLAVTNGYVMDGWNTGGTGTYAISSAQVADGPPGIPYSLKVTVTQAEPSLNQASYLRIMNRIEGLKFSRLAWGTANAQPISIGFWTKIHRPGLYSVALRSSTPNRSYIASFTHNVADTWEWKTITVPGDTVAGEWTMTNGVGLGLSFMVAIGSAGIAPSANTWYGFTGGYLGVPGTTNGVAATSDTFQITGLIVVPGLDLPSAAQATLIMRPYDQELQVCQRYYQKYAPLGSNTPTPFAGMAYLATTAQITGSLIAPMRIPPAVSRVGMQLSDIYAGNYNLTSLSTMGTDDKTVGLSCVVASGLTIGRYFRLQSNIPGDYVAFDARM